MLLSATIKALVFASFAAGATRPVEGVICYDCKKEIEGSGWYEEDVNKCEPCYLNPNPFTVWFEGYQQRRQYVKAKAGSKLQPKKSPTDHVPAF